MKLYVQPSKAPYLKVALRRRPVEEVEMCGEWLLSRWFVRGLR